MLGRKPGFMQRAEALRRDFHPRLGLGQATDVSDDRKVEAMGRLDAMLGRSLLDAPDVGEDEAPAPDLWRDCEPAASPDRPRPWSAIQPLDTSARHVIVMTPRA
jgi:hypothetical protein